MEMNSSAIDFFGTGRVFELGEGCSGELLESFLSRFQAPAVLEVSSGWWKKTLVISLPLGAILGAFLYFALASSSHRSAVISTSEAISLPNPDETNFPVVEQPSMVSAEEVSPEPIEQQQRDGFGTFWKPLQNSVNLGSGQYRKLLQAGWNYIRQARYAEAAVAFGRAVHLNPKAAEGYYGLALAFFEQGMEDEALAVIERVTGRQDGKAELWLLLGTAYQFQGDEAAARKAYGKYLKLAPHGPYARDVRALLARKELPRFSFE